MNDFNLWDLKRLQKEIEDLKNLLEMLTKKVERLESHITDDGK